MIPYWLDADMDSGAGPNLMHLLIHSLAAIDFAHLRHLFGQFFDPDQVRHWLYWGGYGMLFGLLIACGMGLPLPEDIPLITAGILVAHGHMNLVAASIVGWLGIIGGDIILYSLGYRFGRNIVRLPLIGRHVTLERLQRAEVMFIRYGIWMVAVGRLLAGIRGAMVVTAGTTRFNFVKFIIADGLSAIFSGGMFIYLGIWCGHHMAQMRDMIDKFEGWMYVGAASLVVLLVAFLWVRNRKPKAPAHNPNSHAVVSK